MFRFLFFFLFFNPFMTFFWFLVIDLFFVILNFFCLFVFLSLFFFCWSGFGYIFGCDFISYGLILLSLWIKILIVQKKNVSNPECNWISLPAISLFFTVNVFTWRGSLGYKKIILEIIPWKEVWDTMTWILNKTRRKKILNKGNNIHQ